MHIKTLMLLSALNIHQSINQAIRTTTTTKSLSTTISTLFPQNEVLRYFGPPARLRHPSHELPARPKRPSPDSRPGRLSRCWKLFFFFQRYFDSPRPNLHMPQGSRCKSCPRYLAFFFFTDGISNALSSMDVPAVARGLATRRSMLSMQ